MANKVFNVPVFFIVFRETIEAVIIVSVLLSFLNRLVGSDNPQMLKLLKRQLWFGILSGLFLCLVIGGVMIGIYYKFQNDIYGSYEDLWECVFSLIASLMISVMGLGMLRVSKMEAKWQAKLSEALGKDNKGLPDIKGLGIGKFMRKYAMFMLPFVTVLREGLEAVVFVAGAGSSSKGSSPSSYPFPVFVGLLAGILVGLLVYYGFAAGSTKVFLVCSTCFLYLVAAGLFSKGVWFLETYFYNKATGGDASESGSGPGSYNVARALYHVNCCNPEIDHGWDIFNSIFGWQNTGYYSSVFSYIAYWHILSFIVSLMIYQESRGHLPFTKKKLSDLNLFRRHRKSKTADQATKSLINRVET